jgi:ABC-2 type transport system permease protein
MTQLGASPASLRWAVSDSLALARRNLAHVRQIPEKLIDVTVQPLMFVLLFTFVFGGVIHIPGGSYRQYLIGGIMVQTLTFGMMGPGASLATDLTEGIVDRFRSLPIVRSAFLIGHLIAELASSMLGIVVMTISGLLVGWRIDSSFWEALGGFGLLLLYALAMVWLGLLLGATVRSTDAVQGVAFLVIFPLTFVSNIFVPVGGLPAGLQAIAEYNPVSAIAAAVRTLFGNPTAIPADAVWPLQHPVVAAVAWSLAILLITAPLAARRFRARTSN